MVKLKVHHQSTSTTGHVATGHEPPAPCCRGDWVIGRTERDFSTPSLLEASRWDSPYLLFGEASRAACDLGSRFSADYQYVGRVCT